MKAYKTYQEAKIENPDSEIVTTAHDWDGNQKYVGEFRVLIPSTNQEPYHWLDDNKGWVICKPADYLPTLDWFFDEGHSLKRGDLISDRNGNVIEVVVSPFKPEREAYVLKSLDLEMQSFTETPEEKESFDAIKEIDLDHPITKAKIGENEIVGFRLKDSESPNGTKYNRAVGSPVNLSLPEWDGEGFPYAGVECEFKKYYQDKSEFVKCFIVGETKNKEWLVVHDYADDELHFASKRVRSFEFRPIESPEQKAERERLEAAYYLWLTWCHGCDVDNSLSIDQFSTLGSCAGYLAIVDKTGHRKEK